MSYQPYHPYGYPPPQQHVHAYGQYGQYFPVQYSSWQPVQSQSSNPVWGHVPSRGRGYSVSQRRRGRAPVFSNKSLVLNKGPKVPSSDNTEITELEDGQIIEPTEGTNTANKDLMFVRRSSTSIVSEAVAKKIAERKLCLQLHKSRRTQVSSNSMKTGIAPTWAANTGIARKPLRRVDKPCPFFSKTGICKRANVCPYNHDSSMVAICQKYLRDKCPNSSITCPLSHQPNEFRMPHCRHFPNCNRTACPYPHVKLSDDAQICKEFARLGFCQRGKQCTQMHTWECQEFNAKGVCNSKGCSKVHILRRAPDQEVADIVGEQAHSDQEEENDDGLDDVLMEDEKIKGSRPKENVIDAIVANDDFIYFLDSEGEEQEDKVEVEEEE